MLSPDLITESQEVHRQPVTRVRINWNNDGPNGGGTMTDEAALLVGPGWTASTAIIPVLEKFWSGGITAGQATISLDNAGQRFNPSNASSPLVDGTLGAIDAEPNRGGRDLRVEIQASFSGSAWLTQFVGFIDEMVLSPDYTRCTIRVSDIMTILAGRRASTTLQQNVRSTDYLSTVIAAQSGDPTPTFAVKEPGTRLFPWAWMHHESIAEELRNIVMADGGWLLVNKGGGLEYWNAWHFLTAPAATGRQVLIENADMEGWPERRLTRGRDIYNEVQVAYEIRAEQPTEIVYAGAFGVTVPAGGTIKHQATYDEPVRNIQGFASADWTAVTAGRAAVGPADAGVTVTTQMAQGAEIELVNNLTTHPITFLKLHQRGNPIRTVGDHLVAAGGAAEPVRRKDIGGVVYIQDTFAADDVATRLLEAEEHNAARFRLVNLAAYPALELGDFASFNVPTSSDGSGYGTSTQNMWVTLIEQSFGQNGYFMTIEGIETSNPFTCQAPFRMGTSEYGSGSSGGEVVA